MLGLSLKVTQYQPAYSFKPRRLAYHKSQVKVLLKGTISYLIHYL